MFVSDGSLLQHILRWDWNRHTTVQETFLSPRIDNLQMNKRNHLYGYFSYGISLSSSLLAIGKFNVKKFKQSAKHKCRVENY